MEWALQLLCTWHIIWRNLKSVRQHCCQSWKNNEASSTLAAADEEREAAETGRPDESPQRRKTNGDLKDALHLAATTHEGLKWRRKHTRTTAANDEKEAAAARTHDESPLLRAAAATKQKARIDQDMTKVDSNEKTVKRDTRNKELNP